MNQTTYAKVERTIESQRGPELAIRNRVVELRRVRAGDLNPHPKNWRRHSKAQRTALQTVLEDVGYADALIVRETPDGLMLIDGHLRADLTPDAEVPVLVTDLNDDEADTLLATLDPLAAMADVDTEKLQALVDGLAERIGEATAAVINDLHPGLQTLSRHDEEPLAEEPEPRVQPGQVWQLGSHRIMCGDSTSREEVVRLLDGAEPRLMVTDPPYGVEYNPVWRGEAAERGSLMWGTPRRIGYIPNDSIADWYEVYANSPCEVVYNWAASGKALINGAALERANFQLRAMLVWVKPSFVISRGPYGYQHEICWYGVRKGAKADWIGPPAVSTVWNIGWDKIVEGDSGKGHAAQKPLACMERPMMYHSGDVYEPFCGSGTTIIAAERQRRICYAMELEPRFVDMTIARWEQYTGAVQRNGCNDVYARARRRVGAEFSECPAPSRYRDPGGPVRADRAIHRLPSP